MHSDHETLRVLEKIKRLIPESRVKFYLKWATHRTDSAFLNKRFAHYVNEAYLKGLISKEDVRIIVEYANKTGRFRFHQQSDYLMIYSRFSEGQYARKTNVHLRKLMSQSSLDSDLKRAYWHDFEELGLFEDEAIILSRNIKSLPTSSSTRDLMVDYISYTRSLGDKERYTALESISELLSKGDDALKGDITLIKSPSIKKFIKLQKRINKQFTKRFNQELAEINKKNPHLSRQSKINHAYRQARNYKKGYQNLLHTCRAMRPSIKHNVSAGSFNKILPTLALISGGINFSVMNWDEAKDTKWFKRLGFDLFWIAFSTYIYGKIVSSPDGSFMMKAANSYNFLAVNDIPVWLSYNSMFGSNDEAVREYEKIKNDPRYKESLIELEKYMEEKDVIDKFKTAIQEVFGQLVKQREIRLRELSKEDLEREDVEERVIQAIQNKFYEENMGGFINTYNSGLDRYFYYRLWEVPGVFIANYFSIAIFRQLCMGFNGYLPNYQNMILATYVMYRLAHDPLSYYLRKVMINQ